MTNQPIPSEAFEEAVVSELWLMEGRNLIDRPVDSSALLVKPLLSHRKRLSPEMKFRHSLVLDNNVLSDIQADPADSRNVDRENLEFLEKLVQDRGMELNSIYGLIEQWQTYVAAPDALKCYANYMRDHFGVNYAASELSATQLMFAESTPKVATDLERFVGFVPAILYLYELPEKKSAQSKLEDLFGLVKYAELPFFMIHFYYAALIFLMQERQELFLRGDLRKLKDDLKDLRKVMKTESDPRKRTHGIRNIAMDLALPATSLFRVGLPPDTLMFPYLVTRDRILQLLLSEIECVEVHEHGNGQASGHWNLRTGGLLDRHLGEAIRRCLADRAITKNHEELSMKGSRLQAFSDLYTQKLLDLLDGKPIVEASQGQTPQ